MALWRMMLMLLALPAVADPLPYEVQDIGKSHILRAHISYLVDTAGYTQGEAMAQPFAAQLPKSFYYHPKASFWMRMEVKNNTPARQFVFTIDQWNEATLYYLERGRWITEASGTNLPVAQRPLALHRLLSFPIVIDPGETKLVLFKVRITDPLMRYYGDLYSFFQKVELDEAGHAYRKYIDNQLFVLFILGVVTMLFLYNMSLFLFNRHGTSLILSIYFIVVALVIANIHGITTLYIFRNMQGFEMALALNLAHLTPLIIALFLISFFRWRWQNWEFKLLLAFGVFMVSSWLLSIVYQKSFFYFERRYLEYASFLVVLTSALVKRMEGAAILLVAILVAATTAYFAEFKAVFFDNIDFTSPDLPYLFGILAQVLVFSLAAAYRVWFLQRHVRDMREEQRLMIENQNEQLKKMVAEKTQQLQGALHDLQLQKVKLETANTELVHQQEELQAQAQAIHDLNRQLESLVAHRTSELKSTMRDLDTFLYRTSHDLRRPLMTILGLRQLIGRETDLKRISELMDLVDKTVLGLDRMLKKLIAISTCYQERDEATTYNLNLLLTEVEAIVAAQHLQRNYTLQVNAQVTDELYGNAELLKITLVSVIENAVQYGEDGVVVKINAQVKSGKLEVTVTDNGPGIDPAYQQTVFDMFTRANEKSVGNGLGLYLVRLGVKKLGGEVMLTSNAHEGTTVKIILPAPDQPATSIAVH